MSLIGNMLRSHGYSDCPSVCADPTMPPDLLVKLVRCAEQLPDPRGHTLAANPAVPIDLLVPLLRHYPLSVTQNPVFRIALATTPGFIESLPEFSHRQIASSEGMDQRLIRMVAGERRHSVWVREAAAQNPSCPMAMLEDFPRHAWKVRRALANNPQLTESLQRRLAQDQKRHVREQLAVHPNLLPELFKQLSEPTEHRFVRMALLRNPNVPQSVVERILAEGTPMVREAARFRLDTMTDQQREPTPPTSERTHDDSQPIR